MEKEYENAIALFSVLSDNEIDELLSAYKSAINGNLDAMRFLATFAQAAEMPTWKFALYISYFKNLNNISLTYY